MNKTLTKEQFLAIFERGVTNYINQEAQKNQITLDKTADIYHFIDQNVLITDKKEELEQNVELLKKQFPELKQPIEDAFAKFKEEQKLLISL